MKGECSLEGVGTCDWRRGMGKKNCNRKIYQNREK
jgi:hypothetical protein